MDKIQKKEILARLVRRFEQHRDWDESQTKKSLIEPFWELLGWNIRDPDEVVLEKRVEMDAHLRRADYAFAVGGRILFLVEAKPPKRNLTKDREAIFQLKRYVFNTPGVWVGILTDFEEFVPFLVLKKPDYKNPAEGMLKQFVMRYTDYAERWDELEATFSKDAVAEGALEKLLPRTRKLEVVTEPVDRAFFNDLMKWRLDIARSIARNNPDVTSDTLNEAVNDLLNRILFIRIIEDRGIEPYTILYGEWRKWQREQRGPLWAYLLELFAKLNPKYNGALFRKPEDDPLSNLIIDDKPLHNLIKNLYYPDSPYQFSALPVEIIGNAYERYLGSVLRITPARRVKLEEKPEVRKAGGVYYTPKYIVDYIVEQTLGRLLEGKKPKDVRKIKVLDPACGSGSFLIGAYERIMKYYIDYYTTHPEENKGYVIETRDGNKKLSLKLKKQILVDNIYGVDIDQRAVDMAQFSLYVKMMEGEEFRSLFGEGVLPDLRDNIVCGNSLVGWDILDMGILPDDIDERNKILAKINPMNWEDAFPDVFRRKELKAYHITWVTRNSRVSEEIVKFGKKGGVPVLMDEAAQEIVTEAILEKAKMMNIPVMALSVLSDHVHILIACEESELEKVVQELKGYSSFVLGRRLKSSVAGLGRQRKHWAKGYSATYIRDDKHLRNVIEYIQNNHIKHHQKRNPRLQSWKPVPPDEAFSDKYAIAGGFDVVIGNPPYGADLTDYEKKYFRRKFGLGSVDTACLFAAKASELINNNGKSSFIIPKPFLYASNWRRLRKKLLSNIVSIMDCGKAWKEVRLEQIIYVLDKSIHTKKYISGKILPKGIIDKTEISKDLCDEFDFLISGISESELEIGLKIKRIGSFLGEFVSNNRGAGLQKHISGQGDYMVIGGKQVQRYYINGFKGFISKTVFIPENALIKSNSIIAQNIIAHILYPIDHIKINATIPQNYQNILILDTVNQLTVKNNIPAEFVLGVLNSRLISWYVYRFIFAKAVRTMHFDNPVTSRIPFPPISFVNKYHKNLRDRLISLVRDMLALHKKLAEIKDERTRKVIQKQIEITDKKIDRIVYELYGLSEEEIRIVEGKDER